MPDPRGGTGMPMLHVNARADLDYPPASSLRVVPRCASSNHVRTRQIFGVAAWGWTRFWSPQTKVR